MTTIRNAGHHGIVAIGAAAALTGAVFVAQFAADALIYVGELLIR